MDPTKLKQDFDFDGYIYYPGFLNDQEVCDVRDNVSRYIREVVPKMPQERVYYDDNHDPDSLKQIQKMFEYDVFFKNLMIGSRFEELAATLLNNPVNGINMQYFNKAPGVSLPTPPHQDGYYFKLKPCEAVTMWLALDLVDEENGCVRYARGSHKLGMRSHGKTDTLGFSQGLLDFPNKHDLENEVFYCVQPGDLLVHHALTVHWANGNKSKDRTRKALGFIYYSQDAQEDKAAYNAYQKQLMIELADNGKI